MVPDWPHPDKMEKKLHNVPASNSFKFHCQAMANPTQTVKWLKNGKEFKRYQRKEGFNIREHKSTPMLVSLVPDKGNYTCLVENKYGSINHAFQLDVAGQ
ncbi:Fibroblast growth factor receptor 1-A [Triplophysa tibetana]|uniref:Fibroblast growth factor receptor 1-A n=1 Tax=Triplophysa tibetana TaxID=1572043 RepID=A0A5A9NY90_9TELE|nr:Fibroblast growth factor receptor 1-A [Triplophysa tibetana]